MLNYYKSENGILKEIENLEKDCWVNLVAPTPDEIEKIITDTGIEPDFIKSALDEEETSHIDQEDGATLITVDIPYATNSDGAIIYSTMPIGIIVTADNIITVCLRENSIIRELSSTKQKGISTGFKTRFVLQLLYKVSVRYLQYLRQIDKISKDVENQLRKSMKNQELIQLLDLEKSLVYFSTSLKGNEATIMRLSRGKFIRMYEEDEDILDDVLLELKQAIEMSNIYSNILSGTMDAFASIISNNLNIVMKVLAEITIILAIPTIITSFYGMNVVGLPFADSPLGIPFVILLTIIIALITTLVIVKGKFFK